MPYLQKFGTNNKYWIREKQLFEVKTIVARQQLNIFRKKAFKKTKSQFILRVATCRDTTKYLLDKSMKLFLRNYPILFHL